MRNRRLFYQIFNGLPAKVSFKRRLFISFVLICIPGLIALTIFSYLLTRTNTQRVLLQSQNYQVEQINTSLSSVYQNTEYLSRDLVISSVVQDYLKTIASGDSSLPNDTELSYTIDSSISNHEYVEHIIITTMNASCYSSASAYTDITSFDNIKKKWWYNDMTAISNSYQWFTYATLDATTWRKQQRKEIATQINTMMLARPIYDTSDPSKQLGYLMIYLKKEYLQNIWNSVDWGHSTNIYVFDENQNPIDSNLPLTDYSMLIDKYHLQNDSRLITYNNHNYIYSSLPTGFDNWYTVMITPYAELDHSLTNVFITVLIMIAALIVLIAFLSSKSASNMSRPIIVLSDIINAYHGPNSTRDEKLIATYLERSDEIGEIYRSYMQLEDRMQSLIEEVYVKTLEKKDAQLALLQSQINPHFLYNTLDSINWLALMNHQDEISQMITALSNTFRLSLMKDSEYYVRLDQEIEYIKSYLVLQKFRYDDRLHYSFELPNHPQDYEILRFVLQPIVENSLKHGIDRLPNGGHLLIRIRIEDDMIVEVINDGDQINLSKMDKLLVYQPERSELIAFMDEGYGVQNIYRRIKIVCGNKYGLRYSIANKQTICTIHLPVKKPDCEKPTT
ncbi:two-component system, sensor histidine kinase YesM [Eubacterium oxidoreducens]|uniref:Two-component system, sensor histidine kinase YesM n=2 Tax=Eubacterium oxidoreducens TaxID=1732 RepID=A0A1G6C8E5_EUBOX|nr:two-component system, sensor histidine kinase YesM [Eubacterium oxidoreducens]